MFTICDLNVVDDLWIAFIHGNEKSAPRLEHMRSLPVVVVPTFLGAGMHDLRQLTHISWWDNYHQVRTGQGYFNATTQLIVVVVSVACLLFVFWVSITLSLFVCWWVYVMLFMSSPASAHWITELLFSIAPFFLKKVHNVGIRTKVWVSKSSSKKNLWKYQNSSRKQQIIKYNMQFYSDFPNNYSQSIITIIRIFVYILINSNDLNKHLNETKIKKKFLI